MKMTTMCARGLIAAIVVCFPTIALAQTAPPVRLDDSSLTPRMLALGGRADALANSTSSMFGNPAMMVHGRNYHVDAYGLYDPTVGRFGFGSSAIDSTRQYVAAGLSYSFNSISDSANNDFRRSHDARVNLALPLGPAFGLGFTTRFLDTQPLANTPTPPRVPAFTGFTFDVGVFARPVPQLTFTVAGYSINNIDPRVSPISMGFGASVQPAPVIAIVADAYVDFRTVTDAVRGRYSGGVELFVANHIPIRMGYAFDHIRNSQHSLTAGVGYLDEVWGVEFGMRQGVYPELQTTLMISARFFYRPPQ